MTENPNLRTKEEAIKAQVSDYQRFRKHEQLEAYIQALGIRNDTPKIVLWSFVENDATSREPDERLSLVTRECTVGTLLEDTADRGNIFLADEPNTFTVGLVLALNDGRQIAIRYKSEECELLDEDDNVVVDERDERVFSFVREFDVALCEDYTGLLWDGRSLISYL